jgi:hypothetical protein
VRHEDGSYWCGLVENCWTCEPNEEVPALTFPSVVDAKTALCQAGRMYGEAVGHWAARGADGDGRSVGLGTSHPRRPAEQVDPHDESRDEIRPAEAQLGCTQVRSPLECSSHSRIASESSSGKFGLLTAHFRRRTTGIGVRETVPDQPCGSGRPTGSEFPPSPTCVSRERLQVVRTRLASRIPFRRPAAGAKFVSARPNLPVAGVR